MIGAHANNPLSRFVHNVKITLLKRRGIDPDHLNANHCPFQFQVNQANVFTTHGTDTNLSQLEYIGLNPGLTGNRWGGADRNLSDFTEAFGARRIFISIRLTRLYYNDQIVN